MVTKLIDWTKLKPYQQDKRKSFEEFCYQLAERLYENKGRFTPINDTGGGDGVEFYLTMPNGDEWGWQAKFYFPNSSLRSSNRKNQITNSLNTSIKNHPNLKKWFLCTPSDLNTTDIKWFTELEETIQESYPDIVLEHWSSRKFNSFLSRTNFAGILHYFFGELELDIDWFKSHINKQISTIGSIFNSELLIKRQPNHEIHSILEDKTFVEYLLQKIDMLKNILRQFGQASNELQKEDDQIEWKETRDKTLYFTHQLTDSFTRLLNVLGDYSNWIVLGQFNQVESTNLESIETEISEVIRDYTKTILDFDSTKMPYSGQNNINDDSVERVRRKIIAPLNAGKEIADVFYEIIKKLKNARLNCVNIFGKPYIGKTNLSCDICQERIENNLPAILLLGKQFSLTTPIEEQILRILDIPQNYSWNDFVGALQTTARVYRTKIPIVIDALDEAVTMSIWKNGLHGFSSTIDTLSQVVLITTCRSSYKSEIWQSTKPKNMIELYNFDFELTDYAIKKYFEYYHIKADLTSTSMEQFSNPIFLRIFCEATNPERKTEITVYVGELTLLQIFEDYLKQCNDIICDKMNRHRSVPIVERALGSVANEVWKRKTRFIPLADVVELIDSKKMEDLDWPDSLTRTLLDNGLLIHKDSIEGKDSIFLPIT